MLPITTKAKLLVQETDSADYTTYVFEILDKDDIQKYRTKYIMCVKWPNWDHRLLKNGEMGYLNCMEIRAGVDQWFDGNGFTPYKYDAIQFVKFVEDQKITKNNFIL